MKKLILCFIPTIVVVLIMEICQILKIDNVHFETTVLLICIFLILFIEPFFYCCMIYRGCKTKFFRFKGVVISLFFILLNSIISAPKSIKVYLGIEKWGCHDIDFFPGCVWGQIINLLLFMVIFEISSFVKRHINKKRATSPKTYLWPYEK